MISFKEMFGKKEIPEPPLLASPHIVPLKKGKWVMWENKIAIVANIKEFPAVEIHFVDDIGETTGAAMVNFNHLRLAKHSEIPEKRRHPDHVYANVILGYK